MFAFNSHIGNFRQSNQDSLECVTNPFGQTLVLVCDGMGGHAAGEVASKITVDHFVKEFLKVNFRPFTLEEINDWIKDEIKNVLNAMNRHADLNPKTKDMGTTVTGAIVVAKKTVVFNIGDSRVYFYKNQTLEQITEDQNLLNFLLKNKKENDNKEDIVAVLKKAGRNMYALVSSLGPTKAISIDLTSFENNGGYLIASSDGVHQSVTQKEIIEVMHNSHTDLSEKVDILIDIAMKNGSTDNLSAAIFKYPDEK